MRICGTMKLLVLCAMAAPALAQEGPQMSLQDAPVQRQVALACVFATECREAAPCGETDFAPVLNGSSGGLDETRMVVRAQLSSGGRGVELIGVSDGSTMSLWGGEIEERHFFTRAATGETRYTVHRAEGPEVISYLGVCK